MSDERLAYSVAEAAKAIGVSQKSLRDLIAHNAVPHLRVGRRVLLPVESLRRWVEERARRTSDEAPTVLPRRRSG